MTSASIPYLITVHAWEELCQEDRGLGVQRFVPGCNREQIYEVLRAMNEVRRKGLSITLV